MGLRVNGGEQALNLGDLLREAREKADLSQDDLARELSVHRRTVQNWEAGKTPWPKHRRRIRRFIEAELGGRAA